MAANIKHRRGIIKGGGGGWAAICYNAIDGKNHCLTCDKDGKRRFSNDIPA
ncbi:MAG: hypothetical protein ACR2P4_05415 [Gammaproteobacteria bacterium]